MTLQGIVENIAYTFKQQFNDTLKASIEDSVIEYRSLIMRRDIDTVSGSFQHFMDNFCVEMELVDNSECPGVKTGIKILRSKEELPKALRVKGYGKSPYRYVGSLDRLMPFSFTTPEAMQYNSALPFQGKNVYYGLFNNRLYLFNRKKPCKVFVEGIIEDPRKIKDCNNPNLFYDQIEFACPADMLVGIKNAIKKEYFPNLITDGNEITINKDNQS